MHFLLGGSLGSFVIEGNSPSGYPWDRSHKFIISSAHATRFAQTGARSTWKLKTYKRALIDLKGIQRDYTNYRSTALLLSHITCHPDRALHYLSSHITCHPERSRRISCRPFDCAQGDTDILDGGFERLNYAGHWRALCKTRNTCNSPNRLWLR